LRSILCIAAIRNPAVPQQGSMFLPILIQRKCPLRAKSDGKGQKTRAFEVKIRLRKPFLHCFSVLQDFENILDRLLRCIDFGIIKRYEKLKVSRHLRAFLHYKVFKNSSSIFFCSSVNLLHLENNSLCSGVKVIGSLPSEKNCPSVMPNA